MRSDPISRRARPAKAPLSRQVVVDAAMRVMRQDGLSKVTMRRIAADLDTGPASLYVYVTSVAELHGAMIDELLADLVLPTRVTRLSWRRTSVDVLIRLTELLYAEPALALSAVSLRPSGPRYLALIDWLLQSLRRGDVPVRNAAWGVSLLLQHAVSTAAEQGLRRTAAEATDDHASLVVAIEHIDQKSRPGISWARDELFTGGQDRMRWYFERLIASIAPA